MCALAPNSPIIENDPYGPAYFTYFGWGTNGINGFNFTQWGSYPIFDNPETKVLSFCMSKELIFYINI